MKWGLIGANMGPHWLPVIGMSDRSKLNLRLPEDLREQAMVLAERMGLSLNAFIVMAVRSQVDYLHGRLPAAEANKRGREKA